ncbi:unnamed protein product [Hyaloperonospora brassicae]|uniref:Sugar transporter SWEET1 n=1 Tax=Hyaloperonospora brassicae TaxID=162125 RepID=A0AAV0UPN8_HYABA|nr:unnamed protein product [Hyaloperonospora brassicae]CAI5738815.1 unnamed protein product [Hyaloperonospora brassicae]
MTEAPIVVLVRILATLTACLLFASLLPAIRVVHRQQSTASMPSALPILSMVANCVSWGLYGLLIHDYVPLVATNAVGQVLSLFYLVVYYYYETNKCRLSLEILAMTIVLALLVLFPFVAAHEGMSAESVEAIIGSFSVAVSAVMFGSPLILVKKVVQERNTDYLPLTMISAGAVTCVLWLLYGLLLGDAFVIVPNAANFFISVVQLVLFCIYPRGAEYNTIGSATPEAKATMLAKTDGSCKIIVQAKKTKDDDATEIDMEDTHSCVHAVVESTDPVALERGPPIEGPECGEAFREA